MTVLLILLAVAVAALLSYRLWCRFDRGAFLAEYDQAEQDDLAFYREHPGCSVEDAHRNRDRVKKKYRYF